MYKKEFDYYIYIDFSENLIGYNIIEKSKIRELIPRISKLKHYKTLKHKSEYLNSMKKLFKRNNIGSYLVKAKILNMRENIILFSEVLDFIKKHSSCIIFISVDDFQFRSFKKLIGVLDENNTEVVKESKLQKGTTEYRMSLIIDTQLNIVRRKE
jgi:hypothetical protein